MAKPTANAFTGAQGSNNRNQAALLGVASLTELESQNKQLLAEVSRLKNQITELQAIDKSLTIDHTNDARPDKQITEPSSSFHEPFRNLVEQLEQVQIEKSMLESKMHAHTAIQDRHAEDYAVDVRRVRETAEFDLKRIQTQANQMLEDMRQSMVSANQDFNNRFEQQRKYYETKIDELHASNAQGKSAFGQLRGDYQEQSGQLQIIIEVRDKIIKKLKSRLDEQVVANALLQDELTRLKQNSRL